jgi:hypothetical protein
MKYRSERKLSRGFSKKHDRSATKPNPRKLYIKRARELKEARRNG